MEEGDYSSYENDSMVKIRDIEEKQKILKDRLLLIGDNLIDTKEKLTSELLEMKKDIEQLKEGMEKVKSFTEIISGELSKFARKDDLEILSKQAKMFKPLEFVK